MEGYIYNMLEIRLFILMTAGILTFENFVNCWTQIVVLWFFTDIGQL